MHDVTGDGILDRKELENIFVSEARKIHEKDGEPGKADEHIVQEEVARMGNISWVKLISTGMDWLQGMNFSPILLIPKNLTKMKAGKTSKTRKYLMKSNSQSMKPN